MSLEELRRQVEEEESAPVVDEQEPEQEEEEAEEAEPEPDGEKPEAEGDDSEFELEIEDEPDEKQKPTPEEALIHKLTKQKQKTKEANSEVEELRARLAALEAEKTQPKPQPQSHAGQPKFPDLYDDGIDGNRDKYNQAVAKYLSDMNSFNSRHSEAEAAQQKHKEKMDRMTHDLAVKVAKFGSDNRINTDRLASALNTATDAIDSATGIPGSLAYMLDSVGENNDRVAFYIGTNEGARSKLIQLLQEDKNGLKANSQLTRWAEKLKPKQRKEISKAPEPDQPISGDKSASPSAKKLQEMWEKADGKDFDRLREIRKKARELGVTLKN